MTIENENDGTENNNQNQDQNNNQSQPGNTDNKTTENNQTPGSGTGGEPNTNTENKAHQTSVPSVAASEASNDNITVKVSGIISGEHTVPKGTKVSDVIKKLTSTSITQFSFADENGRTVSRDRVLNDNISITSTAQAGGG